MKKQPELLITASSLDECRVLLDAGADALLIGDERFGLRISGHFSPEDTREAIKIAHSKGCKVYTSMNNLMTNELLKLLPDYIQMLAEAGIDAIEYNDPSILAVVKTCAPQLKLHWNAEMTTTNYATANYWGRRGASRMVTARELNMDEIIELTEHLDIESQVQVHGMTNIYHSKRRLVESYMSHQGRPVTGDNLGKDRGLFLIEAERAEEKFPIYEDVNGTHIMSSEDICILEDLHVLMQAGVDCFKIEGLLKPLAYNVAVVKAYRQAIDRYVADKEKYSFEEEWLERVRKLQDPERELSFGFFYKEQVY